MRRLALAASLIALAAQSACGSGAATPAASPQACSPIQVKVTHEALTPSSSPTPGFGLTPGTQPVGIIPDRDGTSVWLLGTGNNKVSHVMPDGSATEYELPASDLGIQLTQSPDGTVWVPEQYRGAVAAIAPDGSARECRLPGKDTEPLATAVAADGSVWITESTGHAIARLVQDRFTVYPIGGSVAGAEVLAAPDGGAWFTVNGAPILGHVTSTGAVEQIQIGGSGTALGMLLTADGAVWVADFGTDRVVRVAGDRSVTEWKAAPGARPQSLALGPGGTVWLTESGIDRIARVRGGSIEDVYKTGAWPDHLAITSDGWAWFTEYNQDRLGRLRLPAA